MESIVLDFWIRLNELIKNNGFTQDSLSEKCGFSKRRIQNLSQSKRFPDVYEAFLIARELNTTVEYLITGETSPATKQFKQFQDDLTNLLNSYR